MRLAFPGGVWDTAWARCAGLGTFEEVFDMRLFRYLVFLEDHGNHVVLYELHGFDGVDTLGGEDF